MSAYLMHHGIKGQKWGVRRYQNDDGSLTAAGRQRYGGKTDHSSKDTSIVRTLAKSSFSGRKTASNWLANRREEKRDAAQRDADSARRTVADMAARGESASAQASMNKYAEKQQAKADRYAKAAEAQRAANANRKAYEDHTSTGKMVAQDILLSKYGAQNYRAARARGATRVRAFFESTAGITPLATVLAAKGNYDAHGNALVLSAIE